RAPGWRGARGARGAGAGRPRAADPEGQPRAGVVDGVGGIVRARVVARSLCSTARYVFDGSCEAKRRRTDTSGGRVSSAVQREGSTTMAPLTSGCGTGRRTGGGFNAGGFIAG